MRVTGTTTQPLPAAQTASPKLITSLLELIRPIGEHKALVFIKGMGEVPLFVNQPLDERQLYHAIVQHSKEGLVLKELFKLPVELKQILSLQPLMPLEQFITQLSQGKSLKKTLFEAIALQLLQASDPQQVEQQLQQILHLVSHQEIPIPLTFHDTQGYVKFKKREKKSTQHKLSFEAYFQKLGIITGSVTFFQHKKEAHLQVISAQTQALLESHAHSLPMTLNVTIDKKISLSPTTALLDIQV